MAYSRCAIVEYIYMPSVELDSRLIPMYSRMVIRLFLVPSQYIVTGAVLLSRRLTLLG